MQLQLILQVVPERTPPGGVWKVTPRWIIDSEKYNEWMNPADYTTPEMDEEMDAAEAADRVSGWWLLWVEWGKRGGCFVLWVGVFAAPHQRWGMGCHPHPVAAFGTHSLHCLPVRVMTCGAFVVPRCVALMCCAVL